MNTRSVSRLAKVLMHLCTLVCAISQIRKSLWKSTKRKRWKTFSDRNPSDGKSRSWSVLITQTLLSYTMLWKLTL